MEEGISLSELAELIEQGLQKSLQPSYWIVAEISEIQANRNGHCYLELIEKPEDEQNPVAKMRAIIWANVYKLMDPYFESETGSHLSVGMKIMVLVSVTYHALYGLSLQITDINPVYTIGEDEQRRLKIIRQLEEEGIMDLNKEVPLPTVIQRIAVISSPTAAGFQDFMNQLNYNQYGFKFQTTLFPAAMQGVEVEKSIVSQLDAIFQREQEFDAVVIIRGGGARSDLRWFDSYEIAANVAQFPLPVITGIGHDKDQSITDLVANTSLKTPTAVAEFIVSTAAEYAEELDYYHERIKDIYDEIIEKQEQDLQDFMSRVLQSMKIIMLQTNGILKEYQNKIQYASVVRLNAQKNDLSNLQQRMKEQCNRQLFVQQKALDLIETKILAKNPESILRQGYTITTDDSGEIIKSVTQIPDNKTIVTHFSDGEVTSHIA